MVFAGTTDIVGIPTGRKRRRKMWGWLNLGGAYEEGLGHAWPESKYRELRGNENSHTGDRLEASMREKQEKGQRGR